MMTFFPAVLVLVDRRHADRPRDQKPRAHQLERIRVPVLEGLTRFPVPVLAAAAVVTAASALALPWVGFDYNLLNLQAKGTESVAWEKRILATTGRSGFNALASAGSLEELRRKQTAFERLPSVSDVESVLRLIPDEQSGEDRDHQELRAARGPRPEFPLEPGGSRPPQPDACATSSAGSTSPPRRAPSRFPPEIRELREQSGARARAAGEDGPRDRRARAHAPPGAALP